MKNLQPKSRSIRYDNVRSAMAEEMVLSQCLREPALLDKTGALSREMFSSELLGQVFDQLRQRHSQGLEVSVATLTDLREPALLDKTGALSREMFSSELLGQVFDQLRQRHSQGLEVSVATLTDLDPEQMSHIAGIVQRQSGPVSEQALDDCIQTICREYQAGSAKTKEDLMALRDNLLKSKGFKP